MGGHHARSARGSVSFHGQWSAALGLLLESRLAQRVALRLGEAHARDARALYEATRRVPWHEWLDPRTTLAVSATGRSRALRHTNFIGQCVKDAVVDSQRDRYGARPSVDRDDPALRVLAHVDEGRVWLGLDMSTQPLFLRGYRAVDVEAPLKETLAATLLAIAGYTGEEPLVDPMCGGGTIVIEGALWALRHPPGFSLRPAAFRWPTVSSAARADWARLRGHAAERRLPRAPASILGADHASAAIEAARANARQAGVSREVIFRQERAAALELLQGPGLLVTNPPYGARLEDVAAGGRALDELRTRLAAAPGWRAAAIAPEAASEEAPEPVLAHLFNGPIRCVVLGMGEWPNRPVAPQPSGPVGE